MAALGIPAMRPALTCSCTCDPCSLKGCPSIDDLKTAGTSDALEDAGVVTPREGLVSRARRAATKVATKLRSAWRAAGRLGSCMRGGSSVL